MNTPSIPYLPSCDHNVPDDPPTICVAPCPRCTACVGWREPFVICPECGVEWDLTPAQADEFALALLGLSELPLNLFLAAIDQAVGSGLPPSVAYPALQPIWRSTGRFPSLVLADAAARYYGAGAGCLTGAAA